MYLCNKKNRVMSNAFYSVPVPVNEPVKSYAPGTPERTELKKVLTEYRNKQVDIPMYIGGEEIRTGNKVEINPPHDHQHVLGHFHEGDASHVEQAIKAALDARTKWAIDLYNSQCNEWSKSNCTDSES